MSIQDIFILTLVVVVFLLCVYVNFLRKRLNLILSQKKSSEVRLGKVGEVLVPLLEMFPVDIKKNGSTTVFIGQPIDYIHFDPQSGISFIEVKTGNSRLSATQAKLKEHVESGRVSWLDVRLRGQ